MDELFESEAFYYGLICGIKLYQKKIIKAHERGEGILIEDILYYLQDGRERLEEMLDRICE